MVQYDRIRYRRERAEHKLQIPVKRCAHSEINGVAIPM